jgi:hypothetical protein
VSDYEEGYCRALKDLLHEIEEGTFDCDEAINIVLTLKAYIDKTIDDVEL